MNQSKKDVPSINQKPIHIAPDPFLVGMFGLAIGNEFIRISKWGRRKFWSLSYEFWLGRRFDYERKFKFGGFHLRSRQIIQTCNILN